MSKNESTNLSTSTVISDSKIAITSKMATATNTNSQAAADILGEMAEWSKLDEAVDVQKLHRATFDAEDVPADAGPTQQEWKITELLDRIGEGLQAEDATNFQKLTIARNYGPHAWKLKALVPHGEFKLKLKERFPKFKYSKVNRWMVISKNKTEVSAAIEKYPDVAWGPKKMIDFLKGWNPESEPEDDEDDSEGLPVEDNLNDVPLLTVHDEVEDEGNEEEVEDDEASVSPKHQHRPEQTPKGRSGGVEKSPNKKSSVPEPDVKRVEYGVKLSLSFTISVPENVTAEQVKETFRTGGSLTLGKAAPFNYQLSEMTVVEVAVQASDSLDEFEPEAVPQAEAVTK